MERDYSHEIRVHERDPKELLNAIRQLTEMYAKLHRHFTVADIRDYLWTMTFEEVKSEPWSRFFTQANFNQTAQLMGYHGRGGERAFRETLQRLDGIFAVNRRIYLGELPALPPPETWVNHWDGVAHTLLMAARLMSPETPLPPGWQRPNGKDNQAKQRPEPMF